MDDGMTAGMRALWQRLAPDAGFPAEGCRAEVLAVRLRDGDARWVLRLTAPDGRQAVLKQARPSPELSHCLARQDRLARRMTGSDGFARILAADPEAGAAVIEAVPGATLAQRLAAGEDLRGLLQRAGRWLRAVHRATQEPPRPFDPAPHLARVERLAQAALERAGDSATRQAVAQRTARLRQLAGQAAGQAHRPVMVHGDLNPGNLILDGDRTLGIDLAHGRAGPAGWDAARLAIGIVEKTGDRLRAGPGRLLPDPEQAALEQGYGQPLSGHPTGATMAATILLVRWLQRLGLPPPDSPDRASADRALARLADSYFG